MIGADVAQIRRLAAEFGRAADVLDAAESRVQPAVLSAAWRGASADQFRSEWQYALRPRLRAASAFLREAQRSLVHQADQQEATSEAGSGGTGGRSGPASSGAAGTVGGPTGLLGQVSAAVGAAAGAAAAFGDWLVPDEEGLVAVGAWATGLGGLVMGAGIDWMTYVKYGRFAPRNSLGQFVRLADHRWWGSAVPFDRNWVAKPFASAQMHKWATAGKVVGGVGAVVSVGAAAWGQWAADSNDPALSTSEKVGRSATRGLFSGGGGAAGAWAGAQVGVALGTAVGGPVGTVVGGAVGGLVGGLAGSELGDRVGDVLVEPIGQWTENATDAVGKLASGAGDLAADIGDALSFWD